MSTSTRYTFLIHALVALIVGVPMLLVPGRFLEIFSWAPIDPIISRLLGAALLALSWGSFRGWRAARWDQVSILVEAEAIFTILACVGLLRHLLVGSWPLAPWLALAVFALFAIAWILALVRK